MKIFDANVSGSLNVSGSARFFGDLTVDGTINATISGTTSNASALNTTGSARFATTGSNTFNANQTISGSIIPAVTNTYDLGDPTHWWKDIYVSTGSIFIGGIKAISTNSDGTIQVGAQVVQTSASLAAVGLALPPTGSIGTSQSTIVGSQNITGSQSITGSLAVSGSMVVTGSLFINGTSYTAASSGTSGSSGSSGSNGSSGTSGSSGSNGSSGSSGTSGSSGSNGSSGTSGSSGSNGSSGSSGTSGSSGSNGSSGTSGSSGSSGSSGTSGSSGSNGSSGSSGSNGSSGTSGSSGSSGTSGSSGANGSSGTSGSSGSNGSSGSSGTTTITNASDDRVMTSAGGVTLNSEANLTFNGTTLYVAGALGVGTSTPTTTGLIRATNDVIAFYGSDERLKENITPIENSLDILKQINGYYFDWKEMPGVHENEGHDIGVIAQEIDAVLPEIVTTRDNGYMAVKYEKLVALLIQTNKELLNRVEALEAKIK